MKDWTVVLALAAVAVLVLIAGGVVLVRSVTTSSGPEPSSSPSPAPTAADPGRSDSPEPSPQPPTLDPAKPPYPGRDFDRWREFWDGGDWNCTERPTSDDAIDLTCARTSGGGGQLIEVQSDGAGDAPAYFAVLLSAREDRLDQEWQALITSLEPVVGEPTVELILDQGEGAASTTGTRSMCEARPVIESPSRHRTGCGPAPPCRRSS
ncbi:MAG TPA: hypothetical protein VK020_03095 [Microlunatus sp.]|nr:hypothetical protein [Microlunatus sp.]